jgi:hypothetical protein
LIFVVGGTDHRLPAHPPFACRYRKYYSINEALTMCQLSCKELQFIQRNPPTNCGKEQFEFGSSVAYTKSQAL